MFGCVPPCLRGSKFQNPLYRLSYVRLTPKIHHRVEGRIEKNNCTRDCIILTEAFSYEKTSDKCCNVGKITKKEKTVYIKYGHGRSSELFEAHPLACIGRHNLHLGVNLSPMSNNYSINLKIRKEIDNKTRHYDKTKEWIQSMRLQQFRTGGETRHRPYHSNCKSCFVHGDKTVVP